MDSGEKIDLAVVGAERRRRCSRPSGQSQFALIDIGGEAAVGNLAAGVRPPPSVSTGPAATLGACHLLVGATE